ncbi:hypothetical protein [Methanosarcina spherical virus]|nr:hypothetical protein [Methanosarcina spherical virus]
MKIPVNTVIKLVRPNIDRAYLAIQNMDNTATNLLFILPEQSEPETFIKSGFCIRGYGLFELQDCKSRKQKGEFYAYTTAPAGIDVRVLEL